MQPPCSRMQTKTLSGGSHIFQIFIRTLPRDFIVFIKISKPESKVPYKYKIQNQPTLVPSPHCQELS